VISESEKVWRGRGLPAPLEAREERGVQPRVSQQRGRKECSDGV
jgi:hypothetical protein